MTKQSFFRYRAYGSTGVNTTQDDEVLFTAQENVTLRRLIIHTAYGNNNSTVAEVNFQLAVAPNGTDVVDALINIGLNSYEMPYEYLAGGVVTNGNMLTIDTKGMRKLRKGDQIKIYFCEGSTSTSTDDFRYYCDIFLSQ